MNTEQLYNILLSQNLTARHLGSVCASDQLPSKTSQKSLEEDTFYIVNLDPSDEPGSHWVACFIKKNPLEQNVYFDSYGYPPIIPEIRDFLGTAFEYNTRCLQHPLSTACGQWCLLFVWQQLLGHPLNCLIKRFQRHGDNPLLNDREVTSFMNEIFNTKLKVLDAKFAENQIAKSLSENRKTFETYAV